VEYPKDMYALNMVFFTEISTGRRRKLRDSVYRVVDKYPEGDRYHG